MYSQSVFEGGMVVVKLGKAQREAHVHRKLLRSRSPYFQSILAENSIQTTAIRLVDVEAETFYTFLEWLYADCFMLPEVDQWLSLCKVWLLAERFQVPALQNKVVEVFSCRLYPRQVDGLELEIFHYVYDNTGPGSLLRKLFSHIAASYGNPDVFNQMMQEMPHIFHIDYAAQQANRGQIWANQIKTHPWDLTKFLLSESVVVKSEGMEMTEIETERDCQVDESLESLAENRETKRKRMTEQ